MAGMVWEVDDGVDCRMRSQVSPVAHEGMRKRRDWQFVAYVEVEIGGVCC